MAVKDELESTNGSAQICKRCNVAAAAMQIRADQVCEFVNPSTQKAELTGNQEVLLTVCNYQDSQAYGDLQNPRIRRKAAKEATIAHLLWTIIYWTPIYLGRPITSTIRPYLLFI
jgi:myosin-crossreactive antigen